MLANDGGALRPGYDGRGNLIYESLSPLSLTQRLGRLRLACYQFTASLIVTLLMTLALLLGQAYLPSWAGSAIIAVLGLVFLVYQIGLMVRRLHDMDLSGLWVLLSLLPLVNVFFYLYLYLGDGSSAVNRFGTPNPPPGALVSLVGGLFWLLSVLSMLGMVVLMALIWFAPEWLAPWFSQLPVDPQYVRNRIQW